MVTDFLSVCTKTMKDKDSTLIERDKVEMETLYYNLKIQTRR